MATKHPCAGLSNSDIAAFERIAVNDPPCTSAASIARLLQLGMIERAPDKQLRDEIGPYAVPQYYVPRPVHMQWCQWCSEQPSDDC